MTPDRRAPVLVVLAALAALSSLAAGPAGAEKKPAPLVFPPGVEGGYAPVNELQIYYELHGPKDAAAPPLRPTLAPRPASSTGSSQPTSTNFSPILTPVIDTCSGSIAGWRKKRNSMPA